MKRILSMLAAFTVIVAAVAFAKSGDEKTGAAHHSTAAMKSGSWTGEVLDAGCYIGHGAMGAKHVECGLKCAASGMPLMLLTKDGKAVLLTPNHDNPDAYNQLKTMAGRTVTVTGSVMNRNGMQGVDVTAFKPVATVAR